MSDYIDELDAKTKARCEKIVRRMEHIMQHGNRLQKIWLVCNPQFILETMWVAYGWRGIFKKSNWEFLYILIKYDYLDKAKLIWQRKVLV